jgi:hypothetical protein
VSFTGELQIKNLHISNVESFLDTYFGALVIENIKKNDLAIIEESSFTVKIFFLLKRVLHLGYIAFFRI